VSAAAITGIALATAAQWVIQSQHSPASGLHLIFDDPLGSMGNVLMRVRGDYWLPANVLALVGAVVPLGVLGAALYELQQRARVGRYLQSDHGAYFLVSLMFAGFVVGAGGERWGLTVPLGLLLTVGVLWRLRDRVGRRRSQLLECLPDDAPPLLDRALRVERVRTARRELRKTWLRGKIDDAPYETEDGRLEQRARRLGYSDRGPEIRDLALARGPAGEWRANAGAAVGAALPLAVVPVGYYISVLITRGVHVRGNGYATAAGVATGVADEVAFWIVAAFCLGAAWSLVPTTAGVTKGVVLALAYLALAIAVSLALPSEDQVGLAFRVFELVIFLGVLGIMLDLKTVGDGGLRDLAVLYRVQEIGPALTYVVPLVASAIVIAEQLHSGNAASAVREVIHAAPNIVPAANR
jgi:hypothetical protein